MRYAQIDPATGLILTFLSGKVDDWPDLVAAGVLRECADDTPRDAIWDGKGFVEPPVLPSPRVTTPLEFRRRFTPGERSAITIAAASYVANGFTILQEMLEDLSGAVEVHLDSEEIRESLDLLIHLELLTAERAAEILA